MTTKQSRPYNRPNKDKHHNHEGVDVGLTRLNKRSYAINCTQDVELLAKASGDETFTSDNGWSNLAVQTVPLMGEDATFPEVFIKFMYSSVSQASSHRVTEAEWIKACRQNYEVGYKAGFTDGTSHETEIHKAVAASHRDINRELLKYRIANRPALPHADLLKILTAQRFNQNKQLAPPPALTPSSSLSENVAGFSAAISISEEVERLAKKTVETLTKGYPSVKTPAVEDDEVYPDNKPRVRDLHEIAKAPRIKRRVVRALIADCEDKEEASRRLMNAAKIVAKEHHAELKALVHQ